MRVRPFCDSDYEALAELFNAVNPDVPVSPDTLRHSDQTREPKYRFGRFVAEEKDHLIGVGTYYQPPAEYHPRKFWLHFALHPQHRSLALFKALYQAVMKAVMVYQPTGFRISVREDREEELLFFQAEGFSERLRNWEMVLDLESFDPTPYRDVEDQLRKEGIQIWSLEEIPQHVPDWLPKLHRLNNEVHKDMPFVDRPTPLSFEEFRRRLVEEPHPDFLRDGWFTAVKGKELVGYHNLWKTENPQTLLVGTTGVARAYRRRGIAFALKLRGIRYAKDRGVRHILTHNDSLNEPILALNRKLGFRPKHGWITMAKEVN